jgi:hypothetical protein
VRDLDPANDRIGSRAARRNLRLPSPDARIAPKATVNSNALLRGTNLRYARATIPELLRIHTEVADAQ